LQGGVAKKNSPSRALEFNLFLPSHQPVIFIINNEHNPQQDSNEVRVDQMSGESQHQWNRHTRMISMPPSDFPISPYWTVYYENKLTHGIGVSLLELYLQVWGRLYLSTNENNGVQKDIPQHFLFYRILFVHVCYVYIHEFGKHMEDRSEEVIVDQGLNGHQLPNWFIYHRGFHRRCGIDQSTLRFRIGFRAFTTLVKLICADFILLFKVTTSGVLFLIFLTMLADSLCYVEVCPFCSFCLQTDYSSSRDAEFRCYEPFLHL
ncbi:hypothetical protein STEG23_006528, partial [Scotinomys teguina]